MASAPAPGPTRRQRVQLSAAAIAIASVVVTLAVLAGPLEPSQDRTEGIGASWIGTDPVGPIISEIVTSNATTLTDEDGDRPDWIELHNPTRTAIDLTGYHLSDDPAQPTRWPLPPITLEPEDHLVVFASGKDRRAASGELHTNFRIAQADEPVLLVGPQGATIADQLEPGPIPRNASYGRHPQHPDRTCYYAFPTPGAANGTECFDRDLGAPSLSANTGFYEAPFQLEITGSDPDASIYYTLNGSYPDVETNPEHTHTYAGPIPIDGAHRQGTLALIDATVTDPALPYFEGRAGPLDLDDVPIERAPVVRARTTASGESTATYLFRPPDRTLPIISLAMEPEYLFDAEQGIYVAGAVFEAWRNSEEFDPDARWWEIPANYSQRGRAWERPPEGDLVRSVVLDHCTSGRECSYQRNVGVRAHGGYSRSRPQKSLRLYARSDYGDRSFSAPMFEAQPDLVGHRRLLLRNAGNDNRLLFLRDAYLQSLLGDMRIDTQAYQPTVVFINGEYWGIHNLRERYDEHYLELVHGADPSSVEYLDNSSGPTTANTEAALAAWNGFLAEVEGAEADELEVLIGASVDVDNLFDYIIAHTFAGNSDWVGNNDRWWRQPGPSGDNDGATLDGRWRWLAADFDHLAGGVGGYDLSYDPLEDRLPADRGAEFRSGLPLLFRRAMEVDPLRDRFLNRFAEHLNTTFSPERTVPQLGVLSERIAPEMAAHSERWQLRPVAEWHAELATFADFMTRRPDHQWSHLVDGFELERTVTVTVGTDGGEAEVELNDLTVREVAADGTLQARYLSGVPISLRATPLDGYRFVAWQDGSQVLTTDPEVVVDPGVTANLTAVLEPSG